MEELLTQRIGSLTNLQQALLKVDTAHSDVTILSAYESSARVLKEILGKPELQSDRVDAVMEILLGKFRVAPFGIFSVNLIGFPCLSMDRPYTR